MSKIRNILIILFLGSCIILSAQTKEKKNPKKAALYSAIIPGAGQIYTKKYWKTPIIYGGLLASAYYIKENNDFYQLYKNTYLNRVNGNNSDNLNYTPAELEILTDHYRRNREISILCFIGTYILNIVDASVSAHLFDYDVSDDLSLHIQPIYFSKENATGLLLSFNL